MAIFRNNLNSNFTQIPNQAITDMRLSAIEFRLYCYLFSKPGTWEINNNDIMIRLGIKTEQSLANYWKHLTKLKLVHRAKSEQIKGRFAGFDYSLLPYQNPPTVVQPSTERNQYGANHSHSNTDSFNNTNKHNNTKNKTETSEKEDFREREIEVIEPEDLSKQVKDLQKENSKKVALKKVKEWDQDVLNCTQAITKLFPDHLKPATINQTQKWIDTIDKLKRIEQIPLKRVYEIVKSVREDDFWSKNFLSLAKLRKKNGDDVMYIVVFNEKFPNATDKSQSKLDQQFRDLQANSNPNDLM